MTTINIYISHCPSGEVTVSIPDGTTITSCALKFINHHGFQRQAVLCTEHSLSIELGRYSNVVRENRYCVCGNNVQTVWHIFIQCPITNSLNNKNYQSLDEIFADENIHLMILSITKKLKIPI